MNPLSSFLTSPQVKHLVATTGLALLDEISTVGLATAYDNALDKIAWQIALQRAKKENKRTNS